MVRTIEDVNVTDVEKRKIPSKHYVYIISVTWSDGSTNIIYRRYSRFFDLQSKIMETFPEEAGAIEPQNRIIPFLPGKKLFGRSHIREVAVKRMAPIALYCRALIHLPKNISRSREVSEFFEMEPDDIDPPKDRKKASIKANKISMPKALEHYVCVTDYTKQEKGEVSLTVGMLAEVAEKTETGWWFVHVEEEQGWVPSTCLEREDGVKEDSTIKYKPGEEVFLCTEEFIAQGADELAMERGAVVDVLEKNLEGWWRVRYNGKEGYVPAAYLMKSDALNAKKKKAQPAKPRPSKPQHPVPQTHVHQPTVPQAFVHHTTVSPISSGGGPEIVRSLVEVSDLLKEDQEFDSEDDDTYDEPIEKDYTVYELSRILKEDKRGSTETEEIYGRIENLKSRSLTRGGSTRPPPRIMAKPKVATKLPAPPARMESVFKEYITVASFSDSVGDGISFQANEPVKVLDKNETGWWYIEIGGREGWAPAGYIEETGTTDERPRAPSPEAVPASKLKSYGGSREDVTEAGKDKSHQSSVGSLADAFKEKLVAKNTPPTTPTKDFLGVPDNTNSNMDTISDVFSPKPVVKDVPKHKNTKPSVFTGLKPTVKDGDNTQPKSAVNSALKPITKHKSPSRGNQPPPPPPPTKSVAGDTKQDIVKPTPPLKATLDIAKKYDDDSKASERSVSKTDSDVPKLNVAGLAGALKAKFESQGAGPGTTNKPTTPSTSNKPLPQTVSNKPVPQDKPLPRSTMGKPSLPSLANKHTSVDKPGLPNKMFPTPNQTTKPKPGLANKPKPTGVANKPPWQRKVETDTSESNTDSGTKVSDIASALKLKFENRQKNAMDDTNTTDSQRNLNKGQLPTTASAMPKPVGAVKPKPARPTAPPAGNKTLQSPFLHNSNASGDSNASKANTAGDKTSKGLDPKKYSRRPLPAKPGPEATNSEISDDDDFVEPTPNVKSAAEMMCSKNKPSPSFGSKSAKPLTTTVVKPKTQKKPFEMEHRSDSDPNTDSRPAGVAGLANALKAKLEGQFSGNIVNKGSKSSDVTGPKSTIVQKPEKKEYKFSTNVKLDSEINNNGLDMRTQHKSDNCYTAIADYTAENDGEVSLRIGQQVQVLDKADGWWLVKCDSVEGWAPAAFLEEVGSTQEISNSNSQTVTQSSSTKQTVYRTCSDFIAENEGEISCETGEEVTVLESADEGWWFVQIGAKEGWVPSAYVQEFPV